MILLRNPLREFLSQRCDRLFQLRFRDDQRRGKADHVALLAFWQKNEAAIEHPLNDLNCNDCRW